MSILSWLDQLIDFGQYDFLKYILAVVLVVVGFDLIFSLLFAAVNNMTGGSYRG